MTGVSSSSGLSHKIVCPRYWEFIRHLLTNRGTTTEALLFVRLAKMSTIFISLVARQAATDLSKLFASNDGVGTADAGGASPTRVALPRDRGGMASVSSSSVFYQHAICARNSVLIPHNNRPHVENTRFTTL